MREILRGRLVVTTKSGLAIPFEEPELVIDTIRQAVESAATSNRRTN